MQKFSRREEVTDVWKRCNLNPKHKVVDDCVVRAISMATGEMWGRVYDQLYLIGREECDLMNADEVWGRYLYEIGSEPFLLPWHCPKCTTVREFAKRFPDGVYIVGTGRHAVAVIDGDWFDIYDSGDMIPSFFWKVIRRD